MNRCLRLYAAVAVAASASVSLTSCGQAATSAAGGAGAHVAAPVMPITPEHRFRVAYLQPSAGSTPGALFLADGSITDTLANTEMLAAANELALSPLQRWDPGSYVGRLEAAGEDAEVVFRSGQLKPAAKRPADGPRLPINDHGRPFHVMAGKAHLGNDTTLNFPELPVPTEPFTSDGKPTKGGIPQADSGLGGLVSTRDGRTVGVVVNYAEGRAFDDQGRTTALPLGGAVLAIAAGDDGNVYVLIRDLRRTENDVRLIALDVHNMTVLRNGATGVRPAADGYGAFSLVPTADGGVVALITTQEGAVQHDFLVTGDSAGVTTTRQLPDGVGLRAAAGPDGSLFLFGGAAANTVNRLDLLSGRIDRDLPTLRTPPGTYVQAVFTE